MKDASVELTLEFFSSLLVSVVMTPAPTSEVSQENSSVCILAVSIFFNSVCSVFLWGPAQGGITSTLFACNACTFHSVWLFLCSLRYLAVREFFILSRFLAVSLLFTDSSILPAE